MTLDKLQQEQKVWAEYNFGERVPELALIGMVEEIGELEEALQEYDEEKIYDSVGDVIIYMADFCNGIGVELSDVWENKRKTKQLSLSVMIGKLCHSFLKIKQNIRGNAKTHMMDIETILKFLLWNLDRISTRTCGFFANTAALGVWEEVKKRDWKKFPENGFF